MAEGGGEFGFYDPELDKDIDGDENWNPEWDNDQDAVNTTQAFKPTTASTPYHGGEQHEMQTMMHEQSGLPDTSYEETPLLGRDAGSITDAEIRRRLDALRVDERTGIVDKTKMADTSVNPLSEEDRAKQIQRVKRLIKANYPNAKVDDMVIRFSKKRPMDIVLLGPRGGETKIVLDNGSGLQKSFLNLSSVKKALGPPASQIITLTGVHIKQIQKEMEKERAGSLTQQQNLKSKYEEKQRLAQRIEKEEAKIDQLKKTKGWAIKKKLKGKNNW